MPQINIQVPHQLPVTDAVARLQNFLEEVRRDHADRISNVQGEWQGDSLRFAFSAMAMQIQGDLHVLTDEVQVIGQLPFAALLFRGLIEQTIREELEKLLR